jgi:hypothetical protein
VDDPGPIIRDKFGAHYIFSDQNGHDDLYFKAIDSGWFDKVYEDEDCFILKLRDTKGPVPTEAQEDGSDGGTDLGGDGSGENEPDNSDGDNGDKGPVNLPKP